MFFIKIFLLFFIVFYYSENIYAESEDKILINEIYLFINHTKNQDDYYLYSYKKIQHQTDVIKIETKHHINKNKLNLHEIINNKNKNNDSKRYKRFSLPLKDNCSDVNSNKTNKNEIIEVHVANHTLKQKNVVSNISVAQFLSANNDNKTIIEETNKNELETEIFPNKNLTVPLETTTIYMKKYNETIARSRVSGDVKFLDVPPGGGMLIPDLELDDGYAIFTFLSGLVGGLQTADFPAGLFKDWLWDRLSFTQLVIQAVRVEGGIIACLILFVIAALALPFGVLAHTSCRITSCKSGDETPPSSQEFSETQLQCRKLVLVILLDLMIILFPLGMVGMFFSNEHLARSVLKSPHVAKAVLDDLNTFVRNTHLQVRFVATTTMDQAVDATIADLEDVEELLGRPIQKELATETGIDIALDALLDICSASADIATEVVTLRAEAQTAREAARTSQERLRELRKQVDTAKRQCVDRDRILCDTVDTIGLDVIFTVDKLLSERKLSRLRHLGEDNLTSAATDARNSFQNIPQRIVSDTALPRQEIKTILRKQRELLYTSAEALEEVSRDFSAAITTTNHHVTKIVHAVTAIEQWRWLTGLVASLFILLIWLMITSGAVCTHGDCSNRVIPLLLTTIVFICTLSILLWILCSISILIGGNGEILMCKPLYDDPNFASLTLLLDNPGMAFKHGGLFSNILNGNDSMDIPVKVVLSECRLNQPAFPTFNLNRIFNIDTLTNHPRWPKLHSHIANISSLVNINDTQILKPTLQKYLQDISSASRVNLTYYRSQLSGSVTQTDLNTFADQLERIASQISDLQTQARMETLAARARKLLANNLQRLEKHRDEIVYKLTSLEVKLLPLQRQANQSLSHLKTIQFYFVNQGTHISERKTNEYLTRLIKYLERFREHVLNQLTYEVAPCRPVWDIFNAARKQICKHIVEPMNGFWMSTIWCLILLFFITPIIMSLIEYYRIMNANGFLRRDLNELLISDQGVWATPQSTPESAVSPEQSSWTTPRRPSEQHLIPSISSRRTPEPPQPPSLRRLIQSHITPRTRMHESLKLIEPISWKNHGPYSIPSPRGWL